MTVLAHFWFWNVRVSTYCMPGPVARAGNVDIHEPCNVTVCFPGTHSRRQRLKQVSWVVGREGSHTLWIFLAPGCFETLEALATDNTGLCPVRAMAGGAPSAASSGWKGSFPPLAFTKPTVT